MDTIVLGILDSKGALKEKDLFKKFVNKCTDCIDGNKEHNLRIFNDTLAKLTASHQIMSKNGEYCINKVVVKKRKRSESEDDIGAVGLVQVQGANGAKDTEKTWNYPELWKNGEKFWREKSFDPEYLRINPDE